MRAVTLLTLAAIAAVSAHADFSYTSTMKVTGGTMAAYAGTAANRTTKYSLKGQKMKLDMGDIAMIMDFDAQTITTVNNTAKTVSVKSFSDAAAGASGMDVKIDAKETGQKKTINGFSAGELVMTMDVDQPGRAGGPAMKMQMEMDSWISSDPPGTGELRAFYTKNASRFPYSAMSGGGANQSMQSAMAEMQKKLAAMNGVAVEMIIRVKTPSGAAGAPGMPQMSESQMAQLAQARAKLEEMAKSGGPAAAMAQQQLARMPGGAPAANSNTPPGVMMEMTVDSTGFSTASVPDSAFDIPADYKKVN